MDYDSRVTSVVVGLDTNINYYKIQYAQLCINNNPGCKLFATNLDKVAHLTKDMEWADGGSIVGAIAGCVEIEPIVVGKPSSVIIDHIVDKFKVQNKSRICMVGDRLDTDVLFGLNSGLATILTLSGVTTEAQLLSETNKIIPRFYINSIADFLKLQK
jgi:HAD superfamily hydrolase (TIGR01450 family)